MIVPLSDPLTFMLILMATILLIFLSRELKKPFIAALPLAVFLILAIVYCVQLGMPELEAYKDMIVNCIALDFIMIFISFFSYLWVDDISCRFYKKKSIDNSLDWFWKNI